MAEVTTSLEQVYHKLHIVNRAPNEPLGSISNNSAVGRRLISASREQKVGLFQVSFSSLKSFTQSRRFNFRDDPRLVGQSLQLDYILLT